MPPKKCDIVTLLTQYQNSSPDAAQGEYCLRINEYKQVINKFKINIFSPLKWDSGAFEKTKYV